MNINIRYQCIFRNVRPSEIYKPPVKERPVFSPMVAKATSKDAYKSPGVPLKRQLIIPVCSLFVFS